MNRNSRDEILRRIKMGLYGDAGHKELSDPIYGTETVAEKAAKIREQHINDNNNNMIEQLAQELSNVNSEVYRASGEDDIFECIMGLIRSKDIESFTAWDSEYMRSLNLSSLLEGEGLSRIKSDDKNEIAKAQIGFTGADYAIADTGTLVLLTDGNKPRSVSLLPPIHLAIVREANIVSNINELFTILQQKYDAGDSVPSCMTFITGPSRTADIELNLTLGVHGPKELHVIITSDTHPHHI